MVWFIVGMPALVGMLVVMLEVARLYLARAELHNALEAAAQAAVKDWADNFGMTGGDTQNARMVGNTYAKANTINGVSVDLSLIDPTLNYEVGEPCNQNACGNGVLVFGAITDDDPDFEFNCCARPRCGIGTVLFDATGQGNLGNGNNNEWGIRFLDEASVPTTLLISKITITLTGTTTFDEDSFGIGDAAPPNKVTDSTISAPDIFGLTDSQITATFLPAGNVPKTVLEFTFTALGLDNGFEKGDRFRFGVKVGSGNGNAQIDGDEIGQPGTQAQIQVEFFDTNTMTTTTASGAYIDTQIGTQGGQCANVGIYDPVHQSLTVFPQPNPIPDLPCPNPPANNDAQSFVQIQGGGGLVNAFAVRAQATYPVPSIVQELFGVSIGPFFVTAKADALLNCSVPQPQLYHLKPPKFLCSVNCP